jgi:hypothetical protein
VRHWQTIRRSENVLEAQVDEERRRREERESVSEAEVVPDRAGSDRAGWRRRPQAKARRRTIGDALRRADPGRS